MQEHGQTAELAIPATASEPDWLPIARTMLPEPGHYVAYREEGEIEISPLPLGWTRIGVVPDFALYPDGRPCDATIFWKKLALTREPSS